jgi:cytoskeletal protein CcmA (bactofilin family)
MSQQGWISTSQLAVSNLSVYSRLIASNLSVTGTSSFNILQVSGLCTMNNFLTTTGTVSMASLHVTGATTLNSLLVTGTTSLNALNVSGACTMASMTVTGNLAVSGVLSVSGGELVPPGTILWYSRSTAPSGWLFCDGSVLATSTYARLFSAVSYTWGSTTGSFTLPDLRGNFIRGWISSVTGILTTSQSFGSLNSATDISNGGVGVLNGQPLLLSFNNHDTILASQIGVYVVPTSGNPSNSSVGVRFSVRPRNVALLPIIKF